MPPVDVVWLFYPAACAAPITIDSLDLESGRMDEQELEAVVLTGGGSRRMGRPKDRLMLGSETLLDRAVRLAGEARFATRVIREDDVPSCGPLGGVYTALVASRADAVLFLCVDMPFITPATLLRIAGSWRRAGRSVFTRIDGRFGFPFIVPVSETARARSAIDAGELSLQAFARDAGALTFEVSDAAECFNVNTPEDWEIAQAQWREQGR